MHKEVDRLECHNFVITEWYDDVYDDYSLTIDYTDGEGDEYHNRCMFMSEVIRFIEAVADTKAIADEVIAKVKERWS